MRSRARWLPETTEPPDEIGCESDVRSDEDARRDEGLLRRRREESTEKPPIDPSAHIDLPAQYAISQFDIVRDPSALIDPSAQYAISQFDIVRVLATNETRSGGYAGRTEPATGTRRRPLRTLK